MRRDNTRPRLPERDDTLTDEQQGAYRKFEEDAFHAAIDAARRK